MPIMFVWKSRRIMISQGCLAQVWQGPASTRALEALPERRVQVKPGATFPSMLTLTVIGQSVKIIKAEQK